MCFVMLQLIEFSQQQGKADKQIRKTDGNSEELSIHGISHQHKFLDIPNIAVITNKSDENDLYLRRKCLEKCK